MTNPKSGITEQEYRIRVAERLRQAREQAGLSQGQAARRLEMHRPTISEIEAGRRRVTAQEVSIFSALYGVSVEWVMDVTGDKTTELTERHPVEIAARELAAMKPEDLDQLINLLQSLRKGEIPKP